MNEIHSKKETITLKPQCHEHQLFIGIKCTKWHWSDLKTVEEV